MRRATNAVRIAAVLAIMALCPFAARAADGLPGSLRNARVARAVPPGEAPPTLTYLAGALSDQQLEELRQVAPNVRVLRASSRAQALEHAADLDGVEARFLSPELLAQAPKLSWTHAPSAGVDRFIGMPALRERPSLVVTNSRGVHGPAIADHAIGMLLALTRRLPEYHGAQRKEQWGIGEAEGGPQAVALQGRTMLVVGIGGIGTEIARRAHAFGMRVIATRRSDAASEPFVDRVGKPEELGAMLPEADVVAVCVPLTKETEKLFDAAMIGRMKNGSYLINIARGRIVDTDALIAALKQGRLAGAALDVTDPEPLPAGHELWKTPNVLITPHTAADGALTDERWWALYKENIRRFGAGEPLLNCVDVEAGY